MKQGRFVFSAEKAEKHSNQVILAGTLTEVQGGIRCKVLAALSTVKYLELELA